jgi:hypothetical protein
MRFCLVSKSAVVMPRDLAGIAAAFNLSQGLFSRAWRLAGGLVASVHSARAGDVVAEFVDVDEGGTLAWHAERDGSPIIQIDVSSVLKFGGGVLDDAGTGVSVSAAFQHEAYETAIDPFANRWVQRADGSWIALEVADPLETFPIYTDVPNLGRVHGADAALPDYFCEDPLAGSPLSLSGKCGAPFENDGYQITIPAGGAVADREIAVNGHAYKANHLAWRQARIEAGDGRGSSRIIA